MPYEDVIDHEKRLVRTRIWGSVTFTEALDHHEKLRERSDFDPTFNQLIDATELVDAHIDSSQAQLLGTRPLFSAGSKRVLVATSAVTFGVGRMVQAFREMAGTKENLLVVSDRKTALRWLEIPED